MSHVPPRERSPLRGRYLVRNRAWNAWLRINDLWLERHAEPASPPVSSPRRMLIAVGGHLGDAVIANGSLAAVRACSPGVEIGVLTGSWNNAVFARHPGVRWLHNIDHWKENRRRSLLAARWITSTRTAARALREIRDVGYDTAVDLSPYYPNASRVLWDARIPVRVGFVSGGGGPLFTHALGWTPGTHITEDHQALLRVVFPNVALATASMRINEDGIDAGARRRLTQKLGDAGVDAGNYAVLHPGAGVARKEWQRWGWTAVVEALRADGLDVVLTGAGARQREITAQIARASREGARDFCDALDWHEYRCLIGGARLVLCVDTVAMHLAAASDTPCVALMTGIDDPARWQPRHGRTVALMRPVPCAPCYRSRGCAAMSCVRDVTPDDVIAAARRSLRAVATHHARA